MHDPQPTARPVSAGTLVMLLAMAAAASTLPAPAAMASDARGGLAESKAVRAVAAVMAAAARDLIGGDSGAVAWTASTVVCTAEPGRSILPSAGREHAPRRRDLAERLLDLPPPTA